jgi:hypothetical protein
MDWFIKNYPLPVIVGIIAATSAIVASITTGLINYYSSKKSSDREDRRRREELERKTADERLNKLYIPLLKIMSPSPPYDEGLHLERRDCSRIIDLVVANEMLASPELLQIFGQFTDYFYNDTQQINHGLDLELFNIVDSEYNELKNILGYGSILRQPSKVKTVFNKLSTPIWEIIKEIKYKIFIWHVNRRRKSRQ